MAYPVTYDVERPEAYKRLTVDVDVEADDDDSDDLASDGSYSSHGAMDMGRASDDVIDTADAAVE